MASQWYYFIFYFIYFFTAHLSNTHTSSLTTTAISDNGVCMFPYVCLPIYLSSEMKIVITYETNKQQKTDANNGNGLFTGWRKNKTNY